VQRSLRRSLVITSVSLAACDPAWHVAIQQPITPIVTRECIATALGTSPHIDSVRTERYSLLSFLVPDSTVPMRRRQGWGEVKHARDSVALLELSIEWRFPAAGVGASPERTRYLAGVGRDLAERVRVACAPELPNTTSCRLKGIFMNKSCDDPSLSG
jgi:hypothetical protein